MTKKGDGLPVHELMEDRVAMGLQAETIRHTLPVDKWDQVTPEEFQSYMRPIGKPLIVTNGMNHWKAMRSWTFEFFKTRYGDDRTYVSNALKFKIWEEEVTLKEYLDYIALLGGTRLHRLQEQCKLTTPLYAYDYQPFGKHPELLEDFRLPLFVDDWCEHFSESFKERFFPFWQGWILFATEGAVSHLHKDAFSTITWFAQIRGRKRCILFSPEDSKFLYKGRVHPLQPDFDAFPLSQYARPFECLLEPGDMLFLPPTWWHHVITLEKSITISYNIVNHINFGYYIRGIYGQRLPQRLSLLPVE